MSIQFTSKKVGELLKEGNLRIPSYQRPYKWNRKHIRNLFYDFHFYWFLDMIEYK